MEWKLVEKWAYVYVGRGIAILGIIGNLFSLFILRRKNLVESPYTYLTALAVADFLVLVIMQGLGSIRCGPCDLGPKQLFYGRIYEVFVYLPLINMAWFASIFLTLALTVERFIFVRFPLLARSVCVPKRARSVVTGTALLVVLVHVPRFFLFTIHPFESMETTAGSKQPPLIFECIFTPAKTSNRPINLSSVSCVVSQLHNASSNECLFPTGLALYRNNKVHGQFIFVKNETCSKEVDNQQTIYYFHVREAFANMRYMTSVFGKKSSDSNDFQVQSCQMLNSRSGITNCDRANKVTSNKWSFCANSILVTPLVYFVPKELHPEVLLQHIKNEVSYDKLTKMQEMLFRSQQGHLTINIANSSVVGILQQTMPCLKDMLPSEPALNLQPVLVKKTTFYTKFNMYYFYIILGIELTVITTMTVVNIWILIVFQQQNRKRQKLFALRTSPTRWLHDQNRLTLTLLLITTLAIICITLSLVANEPVAQEIFHDKNDFTLKMLEISANLAQIITNSINILFYALFNSKFQREVKAAFRELFIFKSPYKKRNYNKSQISPSRTKSESSVESTDKGLRRCCSNSSLETQLSVSIHVSVSSLTALDEQENDSINTYI